MFQPLYTIIVIFIQISWYYQRKNEEKRLLAFLLVCHYFLSILYLVTYVEDAYTCKVTSQKNKKEMRKGLMKV